MKPLLVALIFVFTLMAGGFYYENYYPPNKLKKATQASLNQFAEAVATKDLTKVSEALNTLLTDDAKVNLEVGIFAGITNQTPMTKQEFDKQSFIDFINNTLYSLSDYAYNPKLIKHDASAIASGTAPVEFTSNDWADGNNMYGGLAVAMRFTTDVSCTGTTKFDEAFVVKLSAANCVVKLRQVPKPGQADKFQNMDSVRDLLMKGQ